MKSLLHRVKNNVSITCTLNFFYLSQLTIKMMITCLWLCRNLWIKVTLRQMNIRAGNLYSSFYIQCNLNIWKSAQKVLLQDPVETNQRKGQQNHLGHKPNTLLTTQHHQCYFLSILVFSLVFWICFKQRN